MSSAFDTHFRDNALTALQTWHGESLVRWPGGNSGSAVTVEGCLWTPEETATRDADQDGDQAVFMGRIQVPSTASPVVGDTWIINDERYAAVSVSAPHGTLQTVVVKHVDKVQTSRHRGDYY